MSPLTLTPALLLSSSTFTQGLLDYLLVCCQVKYGGLRDKPGRGRDFYHTCYCLSGLAVSIAEPPSPPDETPLAPIHWRSAVGFTHPIFNISAPKVEAAINWYKAQPPVT